MWRPATRSGIRWLGLKPRQIILKQHTLNRCTLDVHRLYLLAGRCTRDTHARIVARWRLHIGRQQSLANQNLPTAVRGIGSIVSPHSGDAGTVSPNLELRHFARLGEAGSPIIQFPAGRPPFGS